MNPHRQKSITRLWRTTLQTMETSTFLCSRSEGEDFVCSTCGLPVKPCLEHPRHECPDKIHGATNFQTIRDRLRSAQNDRPLVCDACGRPLTQQHLSRRPLSEVCPACRGPLIRRK